MESRCCRTQLEGPSELQATKRPGSTGSPTGQVLRWGLWSRAGNKGGVGGGAVRGDSVRLPGARALLCFAVGPWGVWQPGLQATLRKMGVNVLACTGWRLLCSKCSLSGGHGRGHRCTRAGRPICAEVRQNRASLLVCGSSALLCSVRVLRARETGAYQANLGSGLGAVMTTGPWKRPQQGLRGRQPARRSAQWSQARRPVCEGHWGVRPDGQ